MHRSSAVVFPVVAVLAGAAAARAAPPKVPATPASAADVVYAAPFRLREGYHHHWRRESPMVTSGTLLVLHVAPDLVYPRQTAEPVLYVGDQTAERVNVGYPSGYVVAIVPGALDLTRSLLWFGTPALPERVDGKTIDDERARAMAAGIRPPPANRVRLARRDALALADKDELLREALLLVERYAPDPRSPASRAKGIGSDP
jgi:hypothetical protein